MRDIIPYDEFVASLPKRLPAYPGPFRHARRKKEPKKKEPKTVRQGLPRPPHGYRGAKPTPPMREDMAWRANDPCVYCGAPSEHWDHMHSRHRGGWNIPDNLIRACKACNVSKRTLSPLHYMALRANGLR